METYSCSKREVKNNCVFAAIGLANPDYGKIYTGLTECLPVNSNRVIIDMLIIYAYDTKVIFIRTNQKKK